MKRFYNKVMTEGERSNLRGFISWGRLEDALVQSGDIKGFREIVTDFEVTEKGIHFGIKDREDA